MKYLEFYNKLDSMIDKEYIENFLVYNISLVLAGVKPAVTITIKKNNNKLYNNWNKFGRAFLKDLNLEFVDLRQSSESVIIMIYDEHILYNELNTQDHLSFLFNLGYSNKIEINQYVKTLKTRYEKYNCPHELGLFLGIPFEDVKDFMECTTKECILCGYWKVYNDSITARKIFNKYDTIKEYTMKKMLKGNLSRDLALSIKSSFYKNIEYI